MTSDSQRAGYEPDAATSEANWASTGDETPAEFGWARPDASWQKPDNSWSVAHADAAENQPPPGRRDADSPGSWPPPLGWADHPAQRSSASDRSRADEPHRLPQRIPGRIEHPEDPPALADSRYGQTVRAPRAAVPAPPPPLPPQVTPPPPEPEVTPSPLPPQATRIPGASLAAEPPPGYWPPDQHRSPVGRSPYEPPPAWQPARPYEPTAERRHTSPYEPTGERKPTAAGERPGEAHPPSEVRSDDAVADFPVGQGRARVTPEPPKPVWQPPPPYLPGSPVGAGSDPTPAPAFGTGRPVAAARVPIQRSDPDSGDSASAGSSVSASAAVPAASRVPPPSDLTQMPIPTVEPKVYGRAAAEPADERAPADLGDRFPSWAERREAERQFRDETEREFPAGATHWRPAAADPWARDDRPRSGDDPNQRAIRPADRPAARGFAQAPVPPYPPPHPPEWQREPDAALPRPGGAGPNASGPTGPATGIARPVNPSAGAVQPITGPEHLAADEAGDRPPTPRWDDEPQQQRWRSSVGQVAGVDTFKAEKQPRADQPTPPERNGRVLLMVLVAALLLLAIPLGTLWLLGKTSDEGFNPTVGSCVKQDGQSAVAAGCGDAGAYTVVARASDASKCDPRQPHIILQNAEGDNVLCLRPAATR